MRFSSFKSFFFFLVKMVWANSFCVSKCPPGFAKQQSLCVAFHVTRRTETTKPNSTRGSSREKTEEEMSTTLQSSLYECKKFFRKRRKKNLLFWPWFWLPFRFSWIRLTTDHLTNLMNEKTRRIWTQIFLLLWTTFFLQFSIPFPSSFRIASFFFILLVFPNPPFVQRGQRICQLSVQLVTCELVPRPRLFSTTPSSSSSSLPYGVGRRRRLARKARISWDDLTSLFRTGRSGGCVGFGDRIIDHE